jgi:hypothetical protein
MNRVLISIPSVPSNLSTLEAGKIADILGYDISAEKEPRILFEMGGSFYFLVGMGWDRLEERRFFAYQADNLSYFRFEKPDQEIGELKAANKAIADRCNRVEKERDNAVLRLENLQNETWELEKERVSKDLFLQAISAANGKILK